MLCSVTLGHQMPLPGSIGGMPDDRPAWPNSWPHGKLTWDTSTGEGVCLITGQSDPLVDKMASWPEMPLLGRGTSNWSPSDHSLCDQCRHTQGHQMSLHGGWVRLTFCVLGSQPACQLTSCNWPANQPCDKISTCQALGWSDMWWQED